MELFAGFDFAYDFKLIQKVKSFNSFFIKLDNRIITSKITSSDQPVI
jgi:hypothetical protein